MVGKRWKNARLGKEQGPHESRSSGSVRYRGLGVGSATTLERRINASTIFLLYRVVVKCQRWYAQRV